MRTFNIDATATTTAKTYALRVYDAQSGEACSYTGLTLKQCQALARGVWNTPGLVVQVQKGGTDVSRRDTRAKPQGKVRRMTRCASAGSLAGLSPAQRRERMAAAKALASTI